jgi:hypothetical protein
VRDDGLFLELKLLEGVGLEDGLGDCGRLERGSGIVESGVEEDARLL